MKLWLKISLICIVVLIIIVTICCAALLAQAKKDILQVTVENAQSEQNNLQFSFSNMTSYYGRNDLDAVTKSSLIKYCFSNYADRDAVLVSDDGETIYSRMDIQPEMLLPLQNPVEQKYLLDEQNGRNILIVGNKVSVLGEEYSVYVVRDISSVYEDIQKMGLRFLVIGALCIAAGIALIVLFVRLALRPIKNLGSSAKRIAKGEYSQRATITTGDEIGELAQDFNSMAQAVQTHVAELEEIAERRRLFMSALTHEYKTPLTSVIGYSETLLTTKLPEEAVQTSLKHIYDECRRLERLTQKLMALIVIREDIAKTEEPVERLLQNVERSIREVLHQRGIHLIIDNSIGRLPMDADLMQDLLINLIDNASKASTKGQTVTVRAYGRTIEVTDEGMGIAEDEIPRITEPFYMVDKSRSRKKGGSGIGLALAARIAEAHGAKLVIESKIGKGTKVKIIFP